VNKTLEDMQKGLMRAQERDVTSRADIEKFIKTKSDSIKVRFAHPLSALRCARS